MSKLQALRSAKSLGDVADLLNYRASTLSYVLYKLHDEEKYRSFQILKRSGGLRQIHAPAPSLKRLQRNLANLLQDCVDEFEGKNPLINPVAHGFVRGESIIENAHLHRRRRWVFNLDLEDFFPSINFGRVRGFLIKNRNLILEPRVATVIAQIACYQNTLPQGSPCSPVISNLITNPLDMRILKYARAAGCTYSRYADDLTFSTNMSTFPSAVGIPVGPEGPDAHLWSVADPLREIIERSGFKVNDNKTHTMYRRSRQVVTGLVVNQQVGVRSEYRKTVRAMVHRLVTSGTFDLPEIVLKEGVPVLGKRSGSLDELHGMLGFIDSVGLHRREAALSSPQSARQVSGNGLFSEEKTYQKFLFYRTFYAAPRPVIVCEGETDNVYLTHAIRSLASAYPELAEIDEGGKIRLRVRLLKYNRSRTARLIDLKSGGSGDLGGFIARYNRKIAACHGPGLQNPVIVLFDNDDGAKAIRNSMRAPNGPSVPTDVPFHHVVSNLYAVATPGTNSKIEDFFPDDLKARVVDGKTFSDKNGANSNKHYGKMVFAHKVVTPNADKIDFVKFNPLLTNIAAAIRDYASRFIPSSTS